MHCLGWFHIMTLVDRPIIGEVDHIHMTAALFLDPAAPQVSSDQGFFGWLGCIGDEILPSYIGIIS